MENKIQKKTRRSEIISDLFKGNVVGFMACGCYTKIISEHCGRWNFYLFHIQKELFFYLNVFHLIYYRNVYINDMEKI